MQLTTTGTVAGETIDESLGLVKGNTVRARNVGRDITQSIRNLAGGELKSYSGLMTQSRDEAVDRLTEAAEELGADAVVEVRFETSEITQGAAEILAYGTAVTLE
ncbi:MAG: YbjQ family protein [Halobacteriales archaeon]